jgi:hypothetical protein
LFSLFIEEEPSCGPFGDFFGGMLNPTLTFLMFMGLLSTINLQQKELSLTRKEYIRTADALEEARLEAKKQTAILTESYKKTEIYSSLNDTKKELDSLLFTEANHDITDNESAKMKTSRGVIRGYVGVTSLNEKHQVIVGAEAFGQGQEHDLLIPKLEQIRENFSRIGYQEDILFEARLTADNGYHSEGNMEYFFTAQIDGYVADTNIIVAWRKNCRCSSSCLQRIDWFAAKADRHRRPRLEDSNEFGTTFSRCNRTGQRSRQDSRCRL